MNEIANFITTMKRVHDDNSRVKHFARYPEGERSTMYLTPFVYEFFMYNSIYQIDWEKSLVDSQLQYHSREMKEKEKQGPFEGFLKAQTKISPHLVSTAFQRLLEIPIDDSWAIVTPDSRITAERGRQFFENLRQLRERLHRLEHQPTSELHDEVFNYICQCRVFVYDVRNNIFHGRKTLVDATEPNQNRRIEIYYWFLYGLLSLFFRLDIPKQKAT
jgi:hypothetical protein